MGTLTPLVFLFWRSPLWIAGAMVLIHNAIAFVYWVRSSRSRLERRVAWIGSGLFVLANILIFEGAFLGFETARQLYFAFAAYHGFFEIACLSLMLGPRS